MPVDGDVWKLKSITTRNFMSHQTNNLHKTINPSSWMSHSASSSHMNIYLFSLVHSLPLMCAPSEWILFKLFYASSPRQQNASFCTACRHNETVKLTQSLVNWKCQGIQVVSTSHMATHCRRFYVKGTGRGKSYALCASRRSVAAVCNTVAKRRSSALRSIPILIHCRSSHSCRKKKK